MREAKCDDYSAFDGPFIISSRAFNGGTTMAELKNLRIATLVTDGFEEDRKSVV